ncbi:MAG: HAMP domain-containing histidine kinase [Bacilli bacterium]|nr:HAMP domain-containing histidine kinase [Bacilli bacterium]
MKKLRVKVFVTIFLILTIFTFSLLLLSNLREYNREKNSIEDVLRRSRMGIIQTDFEVSGPDRPTFDRTRRDIFIDYNVYNIALDSEGNYKELLRNTNDDLDESEVKKFAERVLSTKKSDLEINLLTKKYSYSIDRFNILTIVDNTNQTNRMYRYMVTSLIIFFIVEIIAYFLTRFLTKWIVKPVEESFEREKRFIGDASHELKTPIAVIMASADAYEQDKEKKWLNNIKSESDRMNKLVTELLDLNSLENKEFKKEHVDLSKLIESSLLPYESLFFENSLKFTYDIKPNIKCEVNEEKIKELISILIDNAIKYSKKNGKVKVSLYTDKDIYLKVSNQGEEIKEEDINRIFDRFYRADKSRNRKSNNYGLGLSIAKKIVDLHNGDISVESKNEKTTFTVKL